MGDEGVGGESETVVLLDRTAIRDWIIFSELLFIVYIILFYHLFGAREDLACDLYSILKATANETVYYQELEG